MKKIRLLLCPVLWLLYGTVTVLAVGKKTTAFWLGLAFTAVAMMALVLTLLMCDKADGVTLPFFPALLGVSGAYAVATVALHIVCGMVFPLPVLLFLCVSLLCFFIGAAAAGALTAALFCVAHREKKSENAREWDHVLYGAEELTEALLPWPEAYKSMKRVADDIRFSLPCARADVEDITARIAARIEELHGEAERLYEIGAEDASALDERMEELRRLVQRRNRQIELCRKQEEV